MPHSSPTIAIMEGIIRAMDVGTWVVDLSRFDHLPTGKELGN